MKIIKNITALLLFTIIWHIPTWADDIVPNLFPRTNLEFSILESELSEGKYLTKDIYELGFISYNNKETPKTRSNKDRMLTLRSEIYIDSIYSRQKLYLVVKPVNYPCNIYLNGELLFVQGNYKNSYTSRIHYSKNVFLVPALIHYNKTNQIAFQLYPQEGEIQPLDKPFISNARDATYYVFYRNFFGPKMILASLLSGFIFFIFFLFTYISRREYNKPQFLFFALMNLFFIFSFVNNIFTYDYSNTFFVELVSRMGFLLSMNVGLLFLIEYTNVYKNKLFFKIGITIFYLPAIILLIGQNNLGDLLQKNNSYPMLVLLSGNILFVIISLKYFIKEKSIKSIILLIVFLLNLFSGFYDSYYFIILKVKPYLMLIPNSVFLMNLTLFFVLLNDNSKIYHLAIKSSNQLSELNENLELLVEQRTEKTNEYANKLEEANKTKDKFFSIIAHDLKNPFNTLIGYSDLLKSDFREYGQDEIYQQLCVIHNTSVNGYNLLENLLKWSQTQTDKIVFEPIKVDLHYVVQLCIDDIEIQSEFKNIDVSNNIPEKYHIVADENLLKTIIRNLISNAIKFTHRNGMVTIYARKDEKVTEVSVKDTGIGIAEDEVKDMFKIDKIFSKVGTNKEKGSGLGLILCKEFVEKHGGEIWIESKLNLGSIINFTIPKIIN